MQRRELCFAVILFCCLCPGFARAQNPVLEGYVMNSVTGQPVPEARVKLTRLDAEPLYTKTDAQGRFQFPNAGPGYSISVERPGFAQRRFPMPGGNVQRPAARAGVNAQRPGAMAGARFRRAGPIRIELAPYAVIAGKVTDPNGLPVEGCSVELLRKLPVAGQQPVGWPAGQSLPGGEFQIVRLNMARTNDLGEFRASRLDPGTYYVVANKSGRPATWPEDFRITYYPRGLDLASAKPIEIAAGQQARADIQILRTDGVRVRGRLTGPAAGDTPAGLVRYTRLMLVPQQNYLLNANGPFTTARSDEFEFENVLPGNYTLVGLTSERPAGDIWGGNDKPAFGITRQIEIKDRDMDGLSVALQPLRDIPGVIAFAEGCTPAPVRIAVRSESQLSVGQQLQAVSGADGKFVLRGLSPGTLKLVFTNVSPGIPLMPLSASLGEREVLRDGFDYPFPGDESLKVVLGCVANRRPQ